MATELPESPLSPEARSDIALAGINPDLVEPDSVRYLWPAWWPTNGGFFGIEFDYAPADGRRRHAQIELRPR